MFEIFHKLEKWVINSQELKRGSFVATIKEEISLGWRKLTKMLILNMDLILKDITKIKMKKIH